MTIRTIGVGAAVTPAVIKTAVSHYTNRKPRKKKPTNDISYDEGLHLIRAFLIYASHHTVDDLQRFTAQWVPHPRWVRIEDFVIPVEYIGKAATALIQQLGPEGIEQVGGSEWWQWRRKGSPLKAEWIEMRSDYHLRKRSNIKSKRVMLYVHGGAYFFGSVDEHRYQMQRHARKLKARVFAPRYRLAPQFPFPCGLYDCLAAYLFLLTIQDPSEIILAGDSAGAGMAVSMLCILRDRGIPLPAGAILISPWVDLTHSFPSLAREDEFDYIPRYGFMQKPSMSWPPPNDDEMETIRRATGQALRRDEAPKSVPTANVEADQGFTVQDASSPAAVAERRNTHHPASGEPANEPRSDSTPLKPTDQLSIEIDGKLVVLKDQIQMYATNQLVIHPLVSPVLQPSLGGLPPMLILTGGGELLRDEQIYLAHKAANPGKYALADHYKARYDPNDEILQKYKPTFVQLQVWDDLCHVGPTLSFTRPAKYMYRSIAQFGAWALARAQHSEVEITEEDDISVVSDSESEDTASSMNKTKAGDEKVGMIGRAGDRLPPFKSHMIRQRVDRNGNIYPLPAEQDLPGCAIAAEEVGVIKSGPVSQWMVAKKQWDTRYASTKRQVQRRRMDELKLRKDAQFGPSERPPPSALAGRPNARDLLDKKKRISYGLAMWSMWGSKHDEEAVKREEHVDEGIPEKPGTQPDPPTENAPDTPKVNVAERRASSMHKAKSRDKSRRRTVSVVDQGQTHEPHNEGAEHPREAGDDAHLTPRFLPEFKNVLHLRTESKEISDAVSTRTGVSQAVSGGISTKAVFSSTGISRTRKSTNASILTTPESHDGNDEHSRYGAETPASRRSLERLQDLQSEVPGAEASNHLRSPSSSAIRKVEGVSDVVSGGSAEEEQEVEAQEPVQKRPILYNRKDTEFQTALQQL